MAESPDRALLSPDSDMDGLGSHPIPEDSIVLTPDITPVLTTDGQIVGDGVSYSAYRGDSTTAQRSKTPPVGAYHPQHRRSMSNTPTGTWPHRSARSIARPHSAASNGSSEARTSKSSIDLPLPDDPDLLQMRVREQRTSIDQLKSELHTKKDEITAMRTKIMQYSQELNSLKMSKGALNEACVTGMMDMWQLQQSIATLQTDKEHLERTNDALRRESIDHDHERRGLLNLIDDSKLQVAELETLYSEEMKRRKDVETNRAAVMERLGLELKWVRKELHDKTSRLKKLARTNARLACKLLAVEADNSESTNIAKMLQKQNQELDKDNLELAGCLMQLEDQIEQLAKDKDKADDTIKGIRDEHAGRMEQERRSLMSRITGLQGQLDNLTMQHSESMGMSAEREEQVVNLEEEKSKLEARVGALSRGMAELQEEQQVAEEAVEKMKRDYVAKLEQDTEVLRRRIMEHERVADEFREKEADHEAEMSLTQDEIRRVGSEKEALKGRVTVLERMLHDVTLDKDTETESIRKQKERDVSLIQREKEDLSLQVQTMEKQLRELELENRTANENIRKMKVEIRENDHHKETLSHQVRVMEWHMEGLFSEKQQAVRSLEDKNLEFIRLQQDLADRSEDLERTRKEVTQREHVTETKIRELEISKVDMTEAHGDAEHRTSHLERQLEEMKREKAEMTEKLKKVRKRRPWLNLQFKIHC
eukprot:evm.model.scf_341EXC.4 EVM.evm.TU.scf_341EXC.4   scf_341EXC:67019-71192(+)